MSVRGSQAGMAEAFLHPSIGRNVRLESIAERIDWQAVERTLAKLRPGKLGAPPYPGLLMTKALLLQQWYGLSDPGLEEALLDRMSFRRFVGLAGDEPAPDHATLWRFRQALSKAGLDQAVLEAVNSQLDAQGLIVRQGTLIDASLIAAQSRPPGRFASRARCRLDQERLAPLLRLQGPHRGGSRPHPGSPRRVHAGQRQRHRRGR